MVRMTGTMVRLHPMWLLTRRLLVLTTLLSLNTRLCTAEGETQAFRAQPGDVTVQAGDKVSRPLKNATIIFFTLKNAYFGPEIRFTYRPTGMWDYMYPYPWEGDSTLYN